MDGGPLALTARNTDHASLAGTACTVSASGAQTVLALSARHTHLLKTCGKAATAPHQDVSQPPFQAHPHP